MIFSLHSKHHEQDSLLVNPICVLQVVRQYIMIHSLIEISRVILLSFYNVIDRPLQLCNMHFFLPGFQVFSQTYI